MRKLILFAMTVLFASCATVSRNTPVSQSEPRRVVGTDNNVRIDAQIFGDELQTSTSLPLKYDITNSRPAAIAVADMVPETTYDPDTGTVTISIGSEVPGSTLLPRLIAIAPGEKKSFSTVARINLMNPASTLIRTPNAVQVKVNFLTDTASFEMLIAMTQKGLYDPKLADELFPKWVERNATVFTNALPMRWSAAPADEPAAPTSPRSGRKGHEV